MMFTDHGEYLGDYDMVEKWPAGVHEVLTRNPLMIAGPDLPRGQVTEALCEMVDLVPTVLELLGVEERYSHSGVSLVKTIKGEPRDPRCGVDARRNPIGAQAICLHGRGLPFARRASDRAWRLPVRQKVLNPTYMARLGGTSRKRHRLHDATDRSLTTQDLCEGQGLGVHVSSVRGTRAL
jgi:arylsulfatase A-like enzyme